MQKYIRSPYRVPSILFDAILLNQDLNKFLCFTFTEGHTADGGHNCLIWEIQGTIQVIGNCAKIYLK